MYKINELPTPCFVIDEGKLEENLKLLHQVEERTGAKILLAQKCFSCFSEYPLIGKYISGTTASGLYEARLGKEEMGLENHVYSPAYRPQDMEELAQICDHIIFNSEKQLRTYLPVLKASGTAKAGLRINPECSTQEGHAIYDPCAPGSRMGIRACDFTDELADLVDGLHFHTLCEQNSDDLETTLRAVEEKFGKWLFKMNWLNMGGGHHITREDYNIERLISCINHMKETYGLQIYLEPGEAFALNAGYNVTEVLDIVGEHLVEPINPLVALRLIGANERMHREDVHLVVVGLVGHGAHTVAQRLVIGDVEAADQAREVKGLAGRSADSDPVSVIRCYLKDRMEGHAAA